MSADGLALGCLNLAYSVDTIVPHTGLDNSRRRNVMPSSKMTAEGLVTIPAVIRAELQLGAGDQIDFIKVAPGRYEIVAATRDVTALKGMFGHARRTVSIDEMKR